VIIIEFGKNWYKSGKWKSRPDGKFFFRFWCGCVAITYTQFDLAGMIKSAEKGKIGFYRK
jgi:hypothetical protein